MNLFKGKKLAYLCALSIVLSLIIACVGEQKKVIAETDATSGSSVSSSESSSKLTPTFEEDERRAVWFSFIDMSRNGKAIVRSESAFRSSIRSKFQIVKKMNMNRVIVHVRPVADAFYPSDYFPSSYYITGKQGKKLKYDPLKIMVEEAHDAKLNIEAWINPYRVTLRSTSIYSLAKSNPARKWYSKSSTKRNVLIYGSQIFFNPAKQQVRDLIVNGVKEIVKNYDVDGIHMDDYFYPSLSPSSYANQFDAPEYKSYVKDCKKNAYAPMSIVNWRRENVNKLVRAIYSAIKEIDSGVEFGISPAGNIDNLLSNSSYYVDIKKWCNSTGYVDYVAPQIYWDFDYGQYSYDKVSKRWAAIVNPSKVALYSGLGIYRAVPPTSGQFGNTNIFKDMVKYTRSQSKFSGFYFYSYYGLASSYTKRQVNAMLNILK
ncbi:MAG: family 10 glycosylhydrolase [Lachnospiraceae bacterium]|nr:family 10 glycosylhydrolase [Lachnospiraceae bacterium]